MPTNFVQSISDVNERIAIIHSNPIYKAVNYAAKMINAVKKKQGYSGFELSETMTEFEEYKFMCHRLADLNFEKSKDYYENYDVVEVVQMLTEKLAMTFEEPSPEIQKEYENISE